MLRASDISFSYNPETPVLKELNFELSAGEHLCVMGESGCGKSTLLKAIYGLLDLDAGSMTWKDQPILGPAYNLIPGIKQFKYVAQDYDLMPFTSVADNVSKYLSRINTEESEKRTLELLEVIGMTAFADRMVKTLSGGQKQRVALARALARNPELLLLDEPFSQVDNFKKNSLRRSLFDYLKKRGIACVVATHDSDDALSFADKMIVIGDRAIVASGSPSDLYGAPTSRYVASIFEDVSEVVLDGQKMFLYPHQIEIIEGSGGTATVTKSYFKGSHWLIELDYEGRPVFANHPNKLKNLEPVSIRFSSEKRTNHPRTA